MPSFGDTALIALIALLLFGPKKLPELARQFGKLMGEFRRASNEFRMQMEDELRVSEQEEQKKKIAAMEAAAPVSAIAAPAMLPNTMQDETIVIDHPHQPAVAVYEENTIAAPMDTIADAERPDRRTAPLPIASSGDLHMMPPASGLPVSRGASPLASVLESIPHTTDPEVAEAQMPLPIANHAEAALHG